MAVRERSHLYSREAYGRKRGSSRNESESCPTGSGGPLLPCKNGPPWEQPPAPVTRSGYAAGHEPPLKTPVVDGLGLWSWMLPPPPLPAAHGTYEPK